MNARDVETDHYAALGLRPAATAAEIKKAYRRLAQQFHPDKNPGDAKAEARFKEISQAYDVLSDQSRRQEYDEARALFASGAHGPRPRAGAGAPGGFTFDRGDLFGHRGGGGTGPGGLGDLFGGLFGAGAGGAGARSAQRGEDLTGEVTVSFADTLSPREAAVRLPGAAACDTCQGSGAKPGTTPQRCATCRGTGLITRNQGGFAFSEPCRECRGTGTLIETPCPSCGGTGRRERLQKIRIPAGVADGQRLRVRGRGAPGLRGGPAGDLEVVVHVAPHPVFGREGSALTLTVPLTFPEAALGTTVTVPTLDGPVTLKVPPGTSSGSRLRVKERGFPVPGKGRGPMLVTLEVAVPARIGAKARAALETFAAETRDDPRAHLSELIAASSP